MICKQCSNLYVTDLDYNEKIKQLKKTLVGVDPGMDDLLYATNGETKLVKKGDRIVHKTPTFRYSQNQRRKDTRQKKYAKILEKDKKNTFIELESVKDLEDKLSKYNSNTCDFKKFLKWLKIKNEINSKLYEYYEKELHRKLIWYSFINRHKSDQDIVNRFKKTFGNEKEVTILMGDWDQLENLKYKEPTKGKSLRKLFKRNGYSLFMINEHNTSCKSFIDGSDMETFKKVDNPRPWKKGKKIRHGLLRSKIFPNSKSNDVKQILMNRDFNGSMNILIRGRCELEGKNIPKYLLRTSTYIKKTSVNIAKPLKKKMVKAIKVKNLS